MPKRIILFIFGRPFIKEDMKLLYMRRYLNHHGGQAWFLILFMMFHFRSFGSVYTSQSDGTQKSHMIFQITFDISLSTVIKFLWYHIWYDMYIHWQIRSYCYIIYLYTQGGQKNSDWSVAKNLLKPKDGGQVKVFIEQRFDLCLPLAETDWLQSLRFDWIFWMIFDFLLVYKRNMYNVMSVSYSITRN